MSWTDRDYNEYIERVEYAADHGTEEGMRYIYNEMIARGCSNDDLVRMDQLHNRSFTIL